MQLFNGDCLEVLRTLPDGCVDLVVTDPPYIIGNTGAGHFGNRNYYAETAPISEGFNLEVLDECLRVLKNTNIYIWSSRAQLPIYFDYFVKGKHVNFDVLTWHKTNPTPACNNGYLADTEYLLFFRSAGVPLYGTMETKKKFYVTPTNKADKERYGHPTIKPAEIVKNLVINSSIRGGAYLIRSWEAEQRAQSARNLRGTLSA